MVQAWNADLGISLGDKIDFAGNSGDRRSGLLGRHKLTEGEGLLLDPCEAIHTVGMHFAIDVLFLDKWGTVRRIYSSLRPWRIAVCWRAHAVLELPSGLAQRLGVQAGHRIELRPSH